MDVGTGIALLGPAKLVEKLLGPTVEYIGGSLASWTRVRVQNLQRVFANAAGKLGPRLNESGAVPPKALKAILEGASFAPDPLAAEYFGGVLASSRTTISRDDRGASLAALVESLSAYELRSHYLVYESVFRLYAKTKRTPQKGTEGLAVYLPYDSYCSAMAFDGLERAQGGVYMVHAFYGLAAKALVHERFISGDEGHLKTSIEDGCPVHRYEFPREGMIVAPTVRGCELFAWAHGLGNTVPDDLFLDGVTLPGLMSIPQVEGARRLNDYQRTVPGATASHSHG